MGLVLPTRMRPFVTTDMFSPLEKLRMGLDLVLPAPARGEDIAVGTFLRRRLGDALVERLAGPLIGGVYGTPIDELSLLAVVPQLARRRAGPSESAARSLARVPAHPEAADAAKGADPFAVRLTLAKGIGPASARRWPGSSTVSRGSTFRMSHPVALEDAAGDVLSASTAVKRLAAPTRSFWLPPGGGAPASSLPCSPRRPRTRPSPIPHGSTAVVPRSPIASINSSGAA